MNQEYINNIKLNGFSIIRKLYSEIEIARALDCLNGDYDESLIWNGVPEINSKDKRIYNLASKNKLYLEIIFNKIILDIIKYFLQDPYYRWLPDDYYNFILNSASARSSGNFLDLHIDSGIPFKGQVPLGIVVITALEKTTKENGATFIMPGTHQSGEYTDRSRKDFEFIELNPVDVIIMDSRTWHGAGENTKNKSRWTINTHFTQWFIKQDVDIPRTIKYEYFNKLTVQEKILLGYCSMSSPDPNLRINIKNGVEFLNSNEIINIINEKNN